MGHNKLLALMIYGIGGGGSLNCLGGVQDIEGVPCKIVKENRFD